MSKAARFGEDDVYVAGHRHNSAYQMIKRPESGSIAHGVRVSGYKEIRRLCKNKKDLETILYLGLWHL